MRGYRSCTASNVTPCRVERTREHGQGAGMADEEQGEELLPIPSTDTDSASLLGQSPQSTDAPLPRPPPFQLRRKSFTVACWDGLSYYMVCFLAILFHGGGLLLLVGSVYAFFFAEQWVFSNLPVWVKVLLGIYAVPAALYTFNLCYDDYRTRRNNVGS